MQFSESPRLLAALSPQPIWLHYKCVPVWEDPDALFLIGWEDIAAAELEDLSLIFGKAVKQTGKAEREKLVALIKAHAVDQPVSDLS